MDLSDPENHMLNNYTYPVAKILAIVKKNRDLHKKEFDQAFLGYRKKMIAKTREMLVAAENYQDVPHHIDLVRPENHLAEYDRAIQMFSLTNQKKVTLDSATFAQLIMDEWSWKQSFTATNARYK
jgi:hypothetical protein